jgi:hypothetical protein
MTLYDTLRQSQLFKAVEPGYVLACHSVLPKLCVNKIARSADEIKKT